MRNSKDTEESSRVMVRLTVAQRKRLEASAREEHRPLSNEIRRRLDRSLQADEANTTTTT